MRVHVIILTANGLSTAGSPKGLSSKFDIVFDVTIYFRSFTCLFALSAFPLIVVLFFFDTTTMNPPQSLNLLSLYLASAVVPLHFYTDCYESAWLTFDLLFSIFIA